MNPKVATTIVPGSISADEHAAMVLTAFGVTKSYRNGWLGRRNAVLRGADLTVRAGEVVGLVGENGSGKSTLMKSWSAPWPPTTARSYAPAGSATARRSRWSTPG